jgi:hydrogenase maturation protease
MWRSPWDEERTGGPGAGPGGTFPVFIVGYGNPMRGDDGVGQEVARRLEVEAGRGHDLWSGTVVYAHQLTPEMAEDAHGAQLAVFIDAIANGRPPGSVSVSLVEAPPPRAGHPFSGCWQDLTPGRLLSLCRELYAEAPPGVVVNVTTASTAPGYGLSPPVEAAVPLAVAAVKLLIAREHPSLRPPAWPRHA